MKIIIIFTFFVSIKCFSSLNGARYGCPPLAKDVFRLVELSKQFDDFHAAVNEKFISSEFKVSKGSLEENVNDMFTVISELIFLFIDTVYDYLLSYLTVYCKTAVELLKPSFHIETDRLIEVIKFDEDFEFCVLTFLFDSGYNVEEMFQIMNVLHLLSRVDKSDFSLENLKLKLDNFISQMSSTTRDKTDVSDKTIEELTKSLTENKIKIKTFSFMFCSTTVSYLNKRFFNPLDKNYSIFETGSLRNFNENEKFQVDFSIEVQEPMLTQKKQLFKWDCKQISKSPEYKFEEYSKAVMKPKGLFKRWSNYASEVKASILNKIKPGNQSSIVNVDNETDGTKILDEPSKTFTLQTLREYLQSNNYYLNLVQYHNILSEVIVHVTIKEGRKIFAGIKYEMSNDNCSKYFHQDTRQIRRMRKLLLLFKIIFEKLFFNMEKELHADINKNNHKKEHTRQMVALLELLNISKNQTEHETDSKCFLIEKELSTVSKPLIGDNHTDLKFSNYYYNGPVYTIFRIFMSITKSDKINY